MRAGGRCVGDLPSGDCRLKARGLLLLLQLEDALLDGVALSKVCGGIALCLERVEFKAHSLLARLKALAGQVFGGAVVHQRLTGGGDLTLQRGGLVLFGLGQRVGCVDPLDFLRGIVIDPALFGLGALLDIAGQVCLGQSEVNRHPLKVASQLSDRSGGRADVEQRLSAKRASEQVAAVPAQFLCGRQFARAESRTRPRINGLEIERRAESGCRTLGPRLGGTATTA